MRRARILRIYQRQPTPTSAPALRGGGSEARLAVVHPALGGVGAAAGHQVTAQLAGQRGLEAVEESVQAGEGLGEQGGPAGAVAGVELDPGQEGREGEERVEQLVRGIDARVGRWLESWGWILYFS